MVLVFFFDFSFNISVQENWSNFHCSINLSCGSCAMKRPPSVLQPPPSSTNWLPVTNAPQEWALYHPPHLFHCYFHLINYKSSDPIIFLISETVWGKNNSPLNKSWRITSDACTSNTTNFVSMHFRNWKLGLNHTLPHLISQRHETKARGLLNRL